METIRHIGVLTSGGDAPGMNAATRAVVRTALSHTIRVSGIMRGYTGLIEGDFLDMDARSVSNVIQFGGTILKTSRSADFYEVAGRAKAAERMRAHGIDALIAIGGDGTFQGLHKLEQEHGIPGIGVPGTIDNDVYGTDFTIGFDTAANTALESIDKIRDTAASHDRMFFIEVMGRACGALGLSVGLAGGAEAILIPEIPYDLDRLCRTLEHGRERGKTSFIIVVSEGVTEGGAREVAEGVKSQLGVGYRVNVLGHIQRGGAPTAFDRQLASRLGRAAVETLLAGGSSAMTGVSCGRVQLVPLRETWEKKSEIDEELLTVAEVVGS
ncbi:MAG: 6-phosphofructokinase [Candidatus Eisenbacteria bacterium]|nr:6-phosphofructokinase [Candidatus Eisenbacteria bacterium]